MKIETLRDVLIRDLQEFHGAEVELSRALPKMARAANNGELASALVEHMAQTRGHTAWTRQALRQLGASTRGRKSRSMRGLIAESRKVITQRAGGLVKDTLVIGITQKLKDYEISACRTMRGYAEILDETEVVTLLEKSLGEEHAGGRKFARIARGVTGTLED